MFKAQCTSVNLHEQWCCTRGEIQLKPKVSKAVEDKLLNLANKHRKDFHKSAPKFCTECINKVYELYPELGIPKKRPSPGNSSDTPSKCVKLSDQCSNSPQSEKSIIDLNDIQLDGISAEKKAELAYALGLSEKDHVRTNCINLGRDRSLPALLDLSPDQYINEVNPVVTSFLKGVFGFDKNFPVPGVDSAEDLYYLCKTAESVINSASPNTLLPLHFRESVLLYTVTGSNIALKTIGPGGPHCSYSAVKRWLNALSNKPPVCPMGDSVIAFDNNQVLQRRWKVKLQNQVQCHIVTVIVNFELRKDGLAQSVLPKPDSWMNRRLTDTESKFVEYIDQDGDIKEMHYRHLDTFLNEQINIVVSQQKLMENGYQDFVDHDVDKIRQVAMFKICYSCKFDNVPKKKLSCPNCKASLTKASMKAHGLDDTGNIPAQTTPPTDHARREERVILVKKDSKTKEKYKISYERESRSASTSESPQIPTVSVQQPVEVNPCSYEAVRVVLRAIGEMAGIDVYNTGKRKWIIVVCDGVPYNLCRRVIACSQVCTNCKHSFNGLDELAQHQNTIHTGDSVSHVLEFGWVLLQPGPGHVEMNMVKGFVELVWPIFWKELAFLMNFRSDAALHSAKKVNDHHKGWTLCRIARMAITQELLVPFVRAELSSDEPNISVSWFMKFIMKSSDPNYGFMCDLIFEFLDAIFMYRAGQRSLHPDMMTAARAKFAKLWCGRVHPLYRELEMSDTLSHIRMDDAVRDLVKESMSLNLTGKENTGEGADFRLEEVNRHVQQWLPANPALNDWVTACSNYDKLREFKNVVSKQQGLCNPNLAAYGQTMVQNIEGEVNAFRTKLRDAEYLMHPTEVRNHITLTGEPLDKDLKYFCQASRDKRAHYYHSFIEHEVTAPIMKYSTPQFLHHPVFVTEEDREKYTSIDNMKISDLISLIEDKLMDISDTDMRKEMYTSWKKTKREKKSNIIDFYLELDEYVENEELYTQLMDEPTDDGENIVQV